MKINLLIILTVLLLSFTGCGAEKVVKVNVEGEENIHSETLGLDSLISIGNGLYYDSTTRIVYWWNGYLEGSYSSSTPSPYYAPNGFPYRYNPETNTFEEIENSEVK